MARYVGQEAEKVSSWEKEEVGVEWLFDGGKKGWPDVK